MPHDRYDWLSRIRSVEREHAAARLAMRRLMEARDRDAALSDIDLKLRDARNALDRLEATYVIRLFAEFESGLRSCWAARRSTEAPSRTRDLMDGLSASERIPFEKQAEAHAVREFRNLLVHERRSLSTPIAISDARHHLCVFFRFLPPKW